MKFWIAKINSRENKFPRKFVSAKISAFKVNALSRLFFNLLLYIGCQTRFAKKELNSQLPCPQVMQKILLFVINGCFKEKKGLQYLCTLCALICKNKCFIVWYGWYKVHNFETNPSLIDYPKKQLSGQISRKGDLCFKSPLV